MTDFDTLGYNRIKGKVINISEGNEFNKNDYRILQSLVEKECYSLIASLNIKQIASVTNLSIQKIRIALKSFVLLNYVSLGAKDNNSNTFYITNKGRKLFSNSINPNYEDQEEL